MVTKLQDSDARTVTTDTSLMLMLLGAAPTSTNRGVAALGTATVDNLAKAFSGSQLVLGAGGLAPKLDVRLPDRTVSVETSWINGSSKITQQSSASHLRMLQKLRLITPGLGTRWLKNRTCQQLDRCDAVLDLAGGDSFADIYGNGVFSNQVAVKRLAFAFEKPLILLPQTIGPFRDPISQQIAREILSRSALVATRESCGLQELEKLFGANLDERFLACPDVAFTLQPKPLVGVRGPWEDDHGRRIIGLNVSGLLWKSNVDFGLATDYQTLVRQLIEWAMKQPDMRLLLIPHVFNSVPVRTAGKGRRAKLVEDSDLAVSLALRDEMQQRWGDRVDVVDQAYEAAELKWIVGHCDFFVGARMHACIAAVSQFIPTVTLAYSKKAAGVMGMLDSAPPVVDLRSEVADSVVKKIDVAFQDRVAIGESLQKSVPKAQQQVHRFFQCELSGALGLRTARPQQKAVR